MIPYRIERAPELLLASHPADGGSTGGRDVHGEAEAMLGQRAVEIVQDDAGLDHCCSRLRVHVQDSVHVPPDVNDESVADRLAALRGAGAPRCHGDSMVAGRGEDRGNVLVGPGRENAPRHDLVDGRVRRVESARQVVEVHVAPHLRTKAGGERGILASVHGPPLRPRGCSPCPACPLGIHVLIASSVRRTHRLGPDVARMWSAPTGLNSLPSPGAEWIGPPAAPRCRERDLGGRSVPTYAPRPPD